MKAVTGMIFMALMVLCWICIPPAIPWIQAVFLAVVCAGAWGLSGDRARGPDLYVRIAFLGVIVGEAATAMDMFPERKIIIWIFTAAVCWIAGYFFHRKKPAVSALVVYFCLSGAVYTELHLERDPWTLLMALFLAVLTGRETENGLTRSEAVPVLLFSAFIFLVAFGIGFSVYPYVTMRHTGILLLDWMVFTCVLLIGRKKADRMDVWRTFLFVSGTYAVFSCWTALERIAYMGFKEGLLFRLFVLHRHPNYVIYPILLSLPLWLFLSMESSGRMKFLYRVGGVLCVFYLLVYSYSRESWVVMSLYLLLFFVLFSRKIQPKTAFIVVGGLGSLTVGSMLLFRELYFRIISIFQYSSSPRFNAWQAFFQLIPDRPWLGYGLGTNRYIYPQALSVLHPMRSPTRQFLIEAHNAYVDILTGVGFPGLILFLVFLGSILRLAIFRKKIHRNLEWKIMLLTATACVIDLFFNYRLHVQDTGTILMLVLGLPAASGINNSKPAAEMRFRFSRSMIPAIAGIICLYAVLPWTGTFFIHSAQSKLDSGNWEKIAQIFSRASMVEPLHAHPHYFLAQCALQTHDLQKADVEYRKAILLNPNYAFYRYHKALNDLSRGDVAAALAQLHVAETLEPYDVDGKYRFLSGILNFDKGNKTTGRIDLWVAMLKNPDLIRDPFWRSHISLEQELLGDYLTFLIYCMRDEQHILKNADELIAIIRIFENAERTDWLEGREDRIARILAEKQFKISEFALYYIRRNRMERAIPILQTAISRSKSPAVYYNILGYIFLLKNDLPAAQSALEAGVRTWEHISLDNIQGYTMLNKIYTATGQEAKRKAIARKLKYLNSGIYAVEKKDITIHVGKEEIKFQIPALEGIAHK